MARRPAPDSTPRLAWIGSSGPTSVPFLGASPAERRTAERSTMARRPAAAWTVRLPRRGWRGRVTSEVKRALGIGRQCARRRQGPWKGPCPRRRVDPGTTGLGLEIGPSSRRVSSRCPAARHRARLVRTLDLATASRTTHPRRLRARSSGRLHVRPNRERVTGTPTTANSRDSVPSFRSVAGAFPS
jgi:hypothetical protein